MGYPIMRKETKMPDSEAKKRWGKENMLLIGLKLHRTKDADIIEYLDGKPRQTIIKDAIRRMIATETAQKK